MKYILGYTLNINVDDGYIVQFIKYMQNSLTNN